MDNRVCGRCSVSQISLFLKNINICRHQELEVVLAITALNDEKFN